MYKRASGTVHIVYKRAFDSLYSAYNWSRMGHATLELQRNRSAPSGRTCSPGPKRNCRREQRKGKRASDTGLRKALQIDVSQKVCKTFLEHQTVIHVLCIVRFIYLNISAAVRRGRGPPGRR